MRPLRGITIQFLYTILRAGLYSILLFVGIVQVTNLFIKNYFSASVLQQQMISHRVHQFKEYVSDHELSATDYIAIQNWCDKQPLVLMELYRGNYLLFNSNYYDNQSLSNQHIEATYYDWYSYYEVSFADGTAELLIYSDESYVLQTLAKLLGLSLSGLLFLVIVLYDIRKMIHYIYLLTDEIEILGNGDLEHPISIKGSNELTMLAKGLEKTRISLVTHQRNEDTILKQNRDMITGLSHDLRTPLTKIMLCTEIILEKKYCNEQELNNYLAQILNNSLQLKSISEHILQYSLSKKRLQELQIRTLGFQEAFFDIFSETVDYLVGLGLEIECAIEWPILEVKLIDLNVRRIMDNIVSNIEKYADRTHPVFINFIQLEGYAGFEFQNKKMCENTSEGYHIGLVNLQSMLAQMEGTYQQISEHDNYKITILFRIV